MALKPSTAKITDFETSFDAVPVASEEGEVIWADVRIDYILSGLTPTVTIRVPIPWTESDTPEERKSKALRCARQREADDLFNLLVGQGEIVPRFPEKILVERLVLVLVSFVFLLCHARLTP